MLTVFLSAAQIFVLRLMNMSLDAMRLIMLRRGYRLFTWLFGFAQSMVFVIILREVITDLGNWAKVFGYALGFATGMVIGMWLEERLAVGYTHLRIISYSRGTELTTQLRDMGYAVTEVSGQGKDGTVTLLNCGIRRRNVYMVEKVISEIDPQAFITAEEMLPVQKGLWPG
jgi:uncharacterized protein YebE (UPF0316 family)